MIKLSYYFVPLLVVVALISAIVKKKNAYISFINGSKEGLNLFKEVFPSVIAMFLSVSILRSSGLLEDLSSFLANHFIKIDFLQDVIPMLIFRPISGSASIAVLQNICLTGPDSLSCRMASTIQGSTDTTLYVLALYFSSVGIAKWRHALKSGLIADMAGMLVAISLSLIFFG